MQKYIKSIKHNWASILTSFEKFQSEDFYCNFLIVFGQYLSLLKQQTTIIIKLSGHSTSVIDTMSSSTTCSMPPLGFSGGECVQPPSWVKTDQRTDELTCRVNRHLAQWGQTGFHLCSLRGDDKGKRSGRKIAPM